LSDDVNKQGVFVLLATTEKHWLCEGPRCNSIENCKSTQRTKPWKAKWQLMQ